MMWRCLSLLLVATLAGCAGESEQPALAEDEAPPGVMRGVVVDPSIQPVADAVVRLSPGGFENTTDVTGNFEFGDLDPGTYTLSISHPLFLNETVVASVREGPNPVVRVVLDVNSEALAYFSAYHFQGFVECAVFPINWCAQINIASIILCEGYGLCLGNVTNDRSLALHWLDGVPDFLQTEMVWDASNSLGENFLFVVGAATEEEIASGFVAALNRTRGPSPLMMQLHAEELQEHSIGGERALLTQLHPSPQEEIPGGCVFWNPCGPSVHLLQDYEYFTHLFFGYEPPEDWLFAVDGAPPGPP